MFLMSLVKALQDLPSDAPEVVVEGAFSKEFLKALGFENLEVVPGFKVGTKVVDHAARKNIDDDIFLHTRKNPYLYMEVKGRTWNLGDEKCANYRNALLQLRGYLLHPSSKSVQWGILMNSLHVQLFRKHGKVIHPVTPCIPIDQDINSVVKRLKAIIEAPKKALTVVVYNNKGGVGKTTTTLNLAAALTLRKKRVLVIDFDPNQSDLGDALNLKPLKGKVLDALKNKDINIKDIITPYKFEHPKLPEPWGFDVVLADEKLVNEIDERDIRKHLRIHDLHKALDSVRNDYDYILIDAPPNWRIFAQKAMYASDVVLIPARHDNLHSLQNAGIAITQFIPEVQEEKRKQGEYGPIPLPIFMNNAFKETDHQIHLMHQAIRKIVEDVKQNSNSFNLAPYFYPKAKKGQSIDTSKMISIPHMAFISRADFMHMPAAFAFKTVREQYLNLALEYFLQ
ncbi:cobalamin biosynthesis protein CobQ [filamentous cyanobacterium CCT1]|nr:cobalamin biosynthesis protein CobQ [filamentous cyanobacterium CCT1]PSN80618.1 cobalamin biosynthesis protein CobQ [filamentous cyanobacterium CCP4]